MNIATVCAAIKVFLLLAPFLNRDGKLDGMIDTVQLLSSKICPADKGVFASMSPEQRVENTAQAIRDACDCDNCDCE